MTLMPTKKNSRKRKTLHQQSFRPTLETLEVRNLFAGDLHGAFLDVSAAADWGETVEVQGRIDQWGWGESGEFDVQWYLSQDATASDDDILLPHADGSGNTLRHPALGRNSGFFSRGAELNVNLALPDVLPVGWSGNDFHLLMRTDASDEVNEWSEGNNFGERGEGIDQAPITINTPRSYLYFSDASYDATTDTVFQDGAIRFHYNLKSQGRMSRRRSRDAHPAGRDVVEGEKPVHGRPDRRSRREGHASPRKPHSIGILSRHDGAHEPPRRVG